MTTALQPRAGVAPEEIDPRGALIRLLIGPADQAAWIRPALLGLTLLAAALFTWNLTVSGYANTYYSAAAQAASQNWLAWFFGSLDASNFITVDKPPLSTMLMGLSVRLFGLSSASILLPEAVAGVATVVVLYFAVRRSFGAAAATIAGFVMAVTPVVVLIFRYNNPDALLALLLVGAAWACVRAIESGGLRWLILAAALIGLGFNTKYLQAYLVLPAFAVAYAVSAPGSIRRRMFGFAIAAGTVIVTSLWWVVVVELTPTALRPYVGGSSSDSAVQLLLGYDGLGRLFGATGGGGGGPGGGGGFGGTAGLLRLFNTDFGGQVSWLIPFALAAVVTGAWVHRRAGRTDRRVAGYLLWTTWFATHAIVFSFMSGIIHPYYSVAVAPAIAALVGAGTVELWRLRERRWLGGLVFALVLVVSGVWAVVVLDRSPGFAPGLGIAVLSLTAAAGIVLLIPAGTLGRALSLTAVGLGLVALAVGPMAYALDTLNTGYAGGDPKAGPAVGDTGAFGGGFDGSNAGPGGGGRTVVSQAVVDYLSAHRGDADWIVAVRSSQGASSLQLAAGAPVMAMGGFTGSDPTPTLEELQAYVRSGRLRFVLVDEGRFGGFGGPGGRGGSQASSEIGSWVSRACSSVTIDGTASGLFDCAGVAP